MWLRLSSRNGRAREKMADATRWRMSSAEPLFAQIEASAIATTIQGSSLLNGLLSGLHLVGLSMLLGSVVVIAASLMGLFGSSALEPLTRAARRASLAGLALSIVTGLLLVSPRIVGASENPTFRVKMGLLITASIVMLGLQHPSARGRHALLPRAVTALLAVALWTGVALAGLAFILLE